ncbi:putative enzyme related to lactoylglutathione lyase [Pontibacter aydingkolensis]|uniref:VOC family protein n=1 Tax=Pontibacter aydingkolensis TaxID=1911536 RepID=A0ABS7CU96_9BACT|nr:VOC family protein [Pontibacter aydingkolensis]MBW7467375.1 VOC family protein [Pontibacter aydingkolensis]
MSLRNNVVGWFEIPVADMQRAVTFYEAVFGFKMEHHPMGDLEMAWFPSNEEGTGAGGTLIYHKEWYKPSTDGVLVYFSSPSEDLANELAKVEVAGGQVLQEKTLIAEDIGYMGVFLDSEGNRIAMHSRK